MRAFPSLFLCGGLLILVAGAIPAAERSESDEQALQAAGLRTSGTALLDFLRLRSQTAADGERLQKLVQDLAGSSAPLREQAAAELLAHGPTALPILRRALHDAEDPAVAERLRHCLQLIQGAPAPLSNAALRLLAQRHPDGAAAALFAYLPHAEDEDVIREVQLALAAVAFRDGKADPVVVRALDDPMPLRRAVAAEVLATAPRGEYREAVVRLLKDRRPHVRLRVAVALANVHVEEAIPVLIALIGELPAKQAVQAERYLQYLAAEDAPKVSIGNDLLMQFYCRAAWADWWKGYEGNALLDEFRKRTLSDDKREKILALIRLLGDASFNARERASRELTEEGSAAAFVLRRFVNDPDPEISQRVRKCLRVVDKGALANVSGAACRLAAMRKPPGAAEVILAYVPYAEDEAAAKEIEATLTALALKDGTADPTFVKALSDPIAVRRAAAAEALCQAGGPEQWDAVRRLLRDADTEVRMRVALALTHAGDREGVPVLIELVNELPIEQNWRARDCLFRLAGDRPPALPAADDPEVKKKSHSAWISWWRDNGGRVELARFDPSENLIGFTLLVEHDNRGSGTVREVGPGGKVRWQITGLQYPVDARVVGGNRVLIAEHGNRVSERDFDGKIIWQKQDFTDQPVNVQRLANGNTFIATEDELVEVDRAGNKVFSHRNPARDMMAAFKFRDGQMVVIARQNQAIWLDAAGKQTKAFQVPQASHYGSIDGLPNGRLLVSDYDDNKVIEFDREGKKVWSVSVNRPTTATRLSNGHTLVASMDSNRCTELDRAGGVVEQWDAKDGQRPYRVRRR